MENIYLVSLIAALYLFLGIFASKISSFLKIPILLVFLFLGMSLGSDGYGISFEDYEAAGFIGTFSLAFILFSGGYDTSWSSIRRVLIPGTTLATLGILLTAVFTGVFAAWLMGWPMEYGLLLGSVVSSTDAAAVFAIFRSKAVGMKGDLQPILEYESGSNDPMAAFLTVFMIGLIAKTSGATYALFLPAFIVRIGVGVLMGLLIGRFVSQLLNKIKLEYDGLYYVIGIGTVLLAYGASEFCYGNGFMTVYVCGVVLGNSRFVYKYGLGRFHDGISWLAQVAMFLTLGLLVNPSEMGHIIRPGLYLAAFMMFLTRPLCVFICMFGSRFSLREQLLVAWGGIRGAAPIVLAIFPCIAFAENPELKPIAHDIFNLVFFIVLSSVLLQGKTLMPLARWLNLDEAAKERNRPPLEFEETGQSDSRMYEIEIPLFSPIVGIELKNIGLPAGVLVYLIRRSGSFVVPNGNTILQPEDGLMMMVSPTIYLEVLKTLRIVENI